MSPEQFVQVSHESVGAMHHIASNHGDFPAERVAPCLLLGAIGCCVAILGEKATREILQRAVAELHPFSDA